MGIAQSSCIGYQKSCNKVMLCKYRKCEEEIFENSDGEYCSHHECIVDGCQHSRTTANCNKEQGGILLTHYCSRHKCPFYTCTAHKDDKFGHIHSCGYWTHEE